MDLELDQLQALIAQNKEPSLQKRQKFHSRTFCIRSIHHFLMNELFDGDVLVSPHDMQKISYCILASALYHRDSHKKHQAYSHPMLGTDTNHQEQFFLNILEQL